MAFHRSKPTEARSPWPPPAPPPRFGTDRSWKVLDGSSSSRQVSAASMSRGRRAEDPAGRTSPEELIGAAHSSCFSMALSNALAKAGTPPETLETKAEVTFQPGQGITGIHLTVRGEVPGMTPDQFADAAETAKVGCPVSQALTGTTITLTATLA